jgi:hypothetical protein
VEIFVSVLQGDPTALQAQFDEAALDYEVEERRNFDGFLPTVSFIFDLVGNFSSVVLPFVIYYMEKNPGSHVEINGVKISGLSADQINALVAGLQRDATSP